MAKALQFWFDYSCPYAYLGSTQVEAIAARTGATLVPKPMLLGGLFRHWALPQKLFATLGEAKTQHTGTDLGRWAAVFGATLKMPAEHPFRTVDALRATLVAGPTMPLIHAFFRAYWIDNRDLGDRAVIADVLASQGHDANAVLEKVGTDAVKDALRKCTDEAIELGFWGAPGFVVDGQIYWGQDRLHQVEAALGGEPPPLYQPGPMAPVDVYFDYSSPYGYFGVTRAEQVFPDNATYHPMLLGAVFKAVGQDNVPMFSMNEAKRRYNVLDMNRFTERFEVPFNFPSNFPYARCFRCGDVGRPSPRHPRQTPARSPVLPRILGRRAGHCGARGRRRDLPRGGARRTRAPGGRADPGRQGRSQSPDECGGGQRGVRGTDLHRAFGRPFGPVLGGGPNRAGRSSRARRRIGPLTGEDSPAKRSP